MMGAALLGLLGALSAYAQTAATVSEGPLAGADLRIDQRLAVRYYFEDQELPGFEDMAIFNYGEEVGRTNFLLTKGSFALGAQLDQVVLFATRYRLDGELYEERQLLQPGVQSPFPDAFVNLDKIYARSQGRNVEVVLGDAYGSFGNGLAFNLVKNTDIDLDTSLRGAKGVFRKGQWSTTLLSGLTNPQQVQQDNRNLDIHPDLRHMISGARVERAELGPATVGVHGVVYRFAREYDECALCAVERFSEPLDAAVAGGTVEAYGVRGLDLVGEADFFSYESSSLFGGEEPAPGYGAYASASAYPGSFVVQVEAKRYLNTERINTWPGQDGYEVVVPPTLEYERVITEDSSATVNSNDVAGFRAKVQHATIPGQLLTYVSFAGFRDWDTAGLHFNKVPENIVHPMAGVQWTRQDAHVLANVGVRQDIRDEDWGTDGLVHADMSVEFPAGPLGEVEIASSAKRFHWGVNEPQQRDFSEMENALALHTGEHWVYTLYQDWSDNPLIGSEGNLGEHVYGAGEVQYKPGSALTLALFAGAYKAGIRCSGGQCRSLPGFEGVRFNLSGTF